MRDSSRTAIARTRAVNSRSLCDGPHPAARPTHTQDNEDITRYNAHGACLYRELLALDSRQCTVAAQPRIGVDTSRSGYARK